MLLDSGLPKFLWAEAVSHAVYLKNRTWTRTIGNTTPYKILYARKPNIGNLHPWGCKVRVHREVDSKLESHSFIGRWMGFDEDTRDGHRIYWPEKRKVSVERNIKFNFDAEEVVVGSLLLEGEILDNERLMAIEPDEPHHADPLATTEPEHHQIQVDTHQIGQDNTEPSDQGRGKRIRKET